MFNAYQKRAQRGAPGIVKPEEHGNKGGPWEGTAEFIRRLIRAASGVSPTIQNLTCGCLLEFVQHKEGRLLMPLVFEKCCLPASFVEKTFSVRSRLFFIVRHGLGLSGQKLPSAQTVFRRIRIRYHAKSKPLEDERPFTDSSGCRPCVRRRPQHCLCADDASGKGLG